MTKRLLAIAGVASSLLVIVVWLLHRRAEAEERMWLGPNPLDDDSEIQ